MADKTVVEEENGFNWTTHQTSHSTVFTDQSEPGSRLDLNFSSACHQIKDEATTKRLNACIRV